MRHSSAHLMSLPLPALASALSLVLLVWASPGLGAARTTLQPLGRVTTVPIGKDNKTYLAIGSAEVRIPLSGPGKVTGYARVTLAAEATEPVAGSLLLGGVPGVPAKLELEFRRSKSAVWGDDRPGLPSGGRKFVLEVPDGEFILELQGSAPDGEPVLVILYYDGPRQPHLEARTTDASGKTSRTKSKKPAVSWVGNAALDVIYNDNILSNSPGYNDDFISGSFPWKFITESKDDMIIAPMVDIEARANPLSWGQTRLKFKTKRWMYARNPIKTNTDFHFYLRQYFGKRQSLELYFHFSPEQYIRQLSDRSPLADPDASINWTEFRFQRNVWNVTWRQKISRKFSAKVLYEENYRYYNQPFMENDISAWEVRGNLTWKPSRVLTWNFDYSYEDAQGRALDEPGESIINSNNSDASYARDLYRIGVDIRHSSLKKLVDRVGFSFLFMDYYYTTTKTLVQDPFHAGRRDMFYKGTVEVRRKVAKPMTLKLAVRRTERVVDSPWEGDITTDKDFTQWLYWTSLNYRF